jgi:hypothetical protein
MLRPRSPLPVLLLFAILAAPASAQGRVVDEGTFIITRPGASSQTESFRISRLDGAMIRATGQLIAGSHRVTSALTTDSVGTPVEYTLDVRDNGGQTMRVSAVTRSGRLASRSQLQHGDESMREWPVTAGNSLILEDELLHQTYFVGLIKRGGSVQVINPRTARAETMTLTPRGLEPIVVGGRQVTATHYSMLAGGTRRDFWLDSAGRLLQVEIPSLGLKATREDLPR